jgi:hypothetical protein
MRQQATVKKPEAKILSFGLAGLIFALSSGVEAQQAGKVYRIGVLSVGVPASSLTSKHFDKGCGTSVMSKARTLSTGISREELSECRN